MKAFTYERAGDVDSALAAVAERPGAKFIAGGTNLVDLMKLQIEQPAHLVDVSRLPLARIEETPEGGLKLGAMTTNSQVAADERVRARYPALVQAIVSGASGQLRNKATTGGNLLQRTRCPYSTTRPSPAISASRDQGAAPWAGRITTGRSSGRANPASRPIPRTWRWR